MRGWLELDIIFGQWAQMNIGKMNDKELDEFETVVDLENPDLMQWLLEGRPLPEELQNNKALLSMIAYAQSPSKSWHVGAGNQNF